MENQLFSWTGWDEIEINCNQFYDCELLVDLNSKWKAGTKVSLIQVDWGKGIMEFWPTDSHKDQVASFNLFVRAEEYFDE